MRDFDAALAAKKDRRFIVVGIESELPLELPHRAFLLLDRFAAEKPSTGTHVWDDLVAIARAIFGDDLVDRWIEAGIGVTRLAAVVEWGCAELGADLVSEAVTEDEGTIGDGGSGNQLPPPAGT